MNTGRNILAAVIVTAAAFALLGNLSLAEQENMNGQSMNRNSGSMQMAMTVNSQDRRFMREAAEGGMAEVMMGQLAIQRTTSDEVRRYAQQMVDDHTRANAELMRIAQSKGMTLPTGPSSRQRSMMTRMQAMNGADFDRMYIREAGVNAHRTMERLFQREIERGSDADVKGFASATLPAVQMHLQMAQQMMGMMMGGGNMNRNMRGNMNSNMGGNMHGNMNSNMEGNMNMGGGNMNRNMNSNRNRNMNGNMNRNMNSNMNRP
jgi:putative membrane protein